MSRAQNYSDYLMLDELLKLQQPKSDAPEHDEMLFIVIHQVYELWFMQILHELDFLCARLEHGDIPRVLHTLGRVLKILKTLVGQIDILETLTPLEFLSFRDRLESASGFESFQFRELEFVLGAKRPSALEQFAAGSLGRDRLEARLQQPSVWQCFLRLMAASDYEIPARLMSPDPRLPTEESSEIQALLIEIYRSDAVLMPVCERLVDLDEGVQEWRYRHVQMVRRTIGTKRGTGGSSGAPYLQTTLFRPLFPDLWAIRTDL